MHRKSKKKYMRKCYSSYFKLDNGDVQQSLENLNLKKATADEGFPKVLYKVSSNLLALPLIKIYLLLTTNWKYSLWINKK